MKAYRVVFNQNIVAYFKNKPTIQQALSWLQKGAQYYANDLLAAEYIFECRKAIIELTIDIVENVSGDPEEKRG